MSKWPSPQDYREAIQHPRACFVDVDLRNGDVALDTMQLPSVHCGQYSAVFRINADANSWAVRCFLHDFADCKERYRRISEFACANKLQCLVEFQMLETGIRVNGEWYPILKMRFVEGASFGDYVQKNLNDRQALSGLLAKFEDMLLNLRTKGIAHGDLQHDNILVSEGNLFLVDYDGLYVPSIEILPNHELGHRNYQHPSRCEKHYGPYLDNFSAWLIKSGLEYLIQQQPNAKELDNDRLVVGYKDLMSPHTSNVLFNLEKQGSAANVFSRRIRTMIQMPVEQVPYIDEHFDIEAELPEIIPAITSPTLSQGGTNGIQHPFKGTIKKPLKVKIAVYSIYAVVVPALVVLMTEGISARSELAYRSGHCRDLWIGATVFAMLAFINFKVSAGKTWARDILTAILGFIVSGSVFITPLLLMRSLRNPSMIGSFAVEVLIELVFPSLVIYLLHCKQSSTWFKTTSGSDWNLIS